MDLKDFWNNTKGLWFIVLVLGTLAGISWGINHYWKTDRFWEDFLEMLLSGVFGVLIAKATDKK